MSREKMPAGVAHVAIKRAYYMCEAMIPAVCSQKGTELHHRKLLSQGGEHTVENLILLCTHCHRWAHDHPAQAVERGLIVRSMHDPSETKVRYRNGTMVNLKDVDPDYY